MDQVRVALEWLKEQHFWVLTGLASIVAVACWYLASSELAKQFTSNQGTIAGEFNATQGLQRRPYHPNDDVNAREEEEIGKLATRVEQIWSQLYTRQQDEVLKWPPQLDVGIARASDKFVEYIQDKKFGDFIVDKFRTRYLNYIKNRFSDLPKIVEALEIDDSTGGRGRSGGLGGFGAELGGDFGGGFDPSNELVEQQDYLVQWHDQLKVKDQLTWNSTPSSLKIWVTQEDLWVYETLLRAIASTNAAAGTDRYTNAAVRDIYEMQVGREAGAERRNEQRIYVPEAVGGGRGGLGGDAGFSAEGGGFGGGFDGGPDMGGFGAEGLGGFGPDGGGDENQFLLGGRYLDGEDAPMEAPAEGSELEFGQEYKRLPVRLVLRADQRWLYRLIVELANAPLPVEVNEVRINPTGDAFGGGGFGGGLGGGGARRTSTPRALSLVGSSSGGFGGGFGGGGDFGGGGGFGNDREVAAFPRDPQVTDVIVRGVIYMFNPPDKNLLSADSSGSI